VKKYFQGAAEAEKSSPDTMDLPPELVAKIAEMRRQTLMELKKAQKRANFLDLPPSFLRFDSSIGSNSRLKLSIQWRHPVCIFFLKSILLTEYLSNATTLSRVQTLWQ
jgi:hypothetical protein